MDKPEKLILPTVDVLMIAYNKEAYIDDAIRGVVKQKGPFRLHLIIMDDCSSDRTSEICASWQKRFPNVISVYRNPQNLGLQRNYLEGFKHCKGKYLAICDADDYWFYRYKLERQIAYMEEHPDCAITFHRVVNLYEESGEKSFSNGGQKIETTIQDLSRGNFITNLSVVYRRELVDLTNLPVWISEDRAPDYAFHMLYASKGRIHFFRRPMGVYRQSSSGNWSLANRFDRLKMSLMVRLNLINELPDIPEAVEGLKRASANILKSMDACAATEEQQQFVADKAQTLGITLPDRNLFTPSRRKVLTRLRAFISRLLPCPRP